MLISLQGCPGWSAPLLFANPQREVFSRRGPYLLSIVENTWTSLHNSILIEILSMIYLHYYFQQFFSHIKLFLYHISHIAWVKVFRIKPEFRILRLTFNRKSVSKFWINFNFKLSIFVDILQVLKFEFKKFRILEILNFHPWYCRAWSRSRLFAKVISRRH